MSRLAQEQEHLAKANRHIAAGERRVTAQALLLTRLYRDGYETGEAELLLKNLQGTLAAWRDHRREILRAIAQLEGHPRHD